MKLGAFSISLAVKDIAKSKAFYEALGFEAPMDTTADKWQIMKNGNTIIGLFEGMFDKNMLTFNPKWDQAAQQVDGPDIREIQAKLEAAGVEFQSKADPDSEGPASFMITDPDGNPILVDQHC